MSSSSSVFGKLLAKISDASNLEICLNKCDIIDLCDIIDIDERSLLLIEDCVRRKCIKMSEDARELLVDKEFAKRPDLFKFAPGVRERIFSVVEALKKICKNSNIMESEEMMNNFGSYLLNQKRTHEINVSANNLNRYLAAHKSVFGISNLQPLAIEQPKEKAKEQPKEHSEPIKRESDGFIFIDLTDSPKKSSLLRVIDSEPTDPSYPSKIITEIKLEDDINSKTSNIVKNTASAGESAKNHSMVSENTTQRQANSTNIFDKDVRRSSVNNSENAASKPSTSRPVNIFDKDIRRSNLNTSENTTSRTSNMIDHGLRKSSLVNPENTVPKPVTSKTTNIFEDLQNSSSSILENTTTGSLNNSNTFENQNRIINSGRIPKRNYLPTNQSPIVHSERNPKKSRINNGPYINDDYHITPISQPTNKKVRTDRNPQNRENIKFSDKDSSIKLQSINGFNGVQRSSNTNKPSYSNNPEFGLINKENSNSKNVNSPEILAFQKTRSYSRLFKPKNSVDDAGDRRHSGTMESGRDKYKTDHEYPTKYSLVRNDLVKYFYNYNLKIGKDFDVDLPVNHREEKNFMYNCLWCEKANGIKMKIKFSSTKSGENYSNIQKHLEYHFSSYRGSSRSPLKRYHNNDYNKSVSTNKKFI